MYMCVKIYVIYVQEIILKIVRFYIYIYAYTYVYYFLYLLNFYPYFCFLLAKITDLNSYIWSQSNFVFFILN